MSAVLVKIVLVMLLLVLSACGEDGPQVDGSKEKPVERVKVEGSRGALTAERIEVEGVAYLCIIGVRTRRHQHIDRRLRRDHGAE